MTIEQQTLDLCNSVTAYYEAGLYGHSEPYPINKLAQKAFELENRIIKQKNLLSAIENAMERWHHARDNDDETLQNINDLLYEAGYLKWFNENTKRHGN